MVESSDKMWSTGEGNGKPLQHSCLENPMNSMKRQKDRTLKGELPGRQVSKLLLEMGREMSPGGMKRLSQRGDNSQLWMCMAVKVKLSNIKNSTAEGLGMPGP